MEQPDVNLRKDLKEHTNDIKFNKQTTPLAIFNLQQNVNIFFFNEAKNIILNFHYHISLIKVSIGIYITRKKNY